MGLKIIIKNKKINGKIISISEDKGKSNIKVLLENIDIDISADREKYALGNLIELNADFELNHIKIKT